MMNFGSLAHFHLFTLKPILPNNHEIFEGNFHQSADFYHSAKKNGGCTILRLFCGLLWWIAGRLMGDCELR